MYGYSQQEGQSVRRTVVNCAKPRGGTNAVLPTGSERCVDHKALCIADGLIKRTTADESEKGIISSKEKTHMGMKLRKRKPGREWGNDGQSCETAVHKYVRPEKVEQGGWHRGCG